jgi:hypothetical protein
MAKRFVPVIVTVFPAIALVGINDVIVGGFITNVKPSRRDVPKVDLTTLTLPVAPAPTTAVIVVGETTLNEEAGVPPKLTSETPVK